MMSTKFNPDESLDKQMQRLTDIRTSDPDRARKIYERGEMMVQYAASGSYRKFKILVDLSEPSEILIYFAVKAFKAALVNSYLMLAQYMIDNGYPITSKTGPLILNDCLNEVADHQGVSLVDFFHSKGFDLNSQARKTNLSALHVAVERQLIGTINTLIEKGADVNIVAAEDKMPLSIAEQAEPSETKNSIIAILRSKGARNTWRTEKKSFSGGGTFNHHEITMVSFKGGNVSLESQQSPVVPSVASTAATTTTTTTTTSVFHSHRDCSSGSESNSFNEVEVLSMAAVMGRDMPVSVMQISAGIDNMNLLYADGKPEYEYDNASFEVSDDGGMNFSTNN